MSRDSSTAQIYMDRMKKVQHQLSAIGTFELLPEFLPQQFIDIGWGPQDTDVVALLGNCLDASQCVEKPNVIFESVDKVFYTIVAVDADDESGAPYLLWLKHNVTGDIRFSSGRDIVRWQPPHPSKGSQAHRIFFFVFHQSTGELDLTGRVIISKNSRQNRRSFNVKELASDLALKHTIGANMCKISFSQAVWDRLEQDLRDEVILDPSGRRVLAEVNGGVRKDF